MYRSPVIAKVRAVPVRGNWLFLSLPIAVAIWQYFSEGTASAVLALLIFLGLYLGFCFQALLQAAAAWTLKVGLRDVTLLPLSVIVRLTWISEKPVYELGVHIAGVLARVLQVGVLYAILVFAGIPISPQTDFSAVDGALFCNRLFWMSIVMLIIDCVPVFPTSMGFLFRAALAMNAKRIRATEITSYLGTFVSLICIGFGFYTKYPYLMLLGVYFLIWSQQELADVRYFASIRKRYGSTSKSPAMVLPEDQVIDIDSRPTVPNFTGFTFNARTKLWIEWKNGEPISANALIGN